MTLHVRQIAIPAPVEYPETDGLPMAENTTQFRWINTIVWELDKIFASDPNVFVAGDLFWYPVEGQPKIVAAPDAMIAFGRPKGDRRCYLQWREDDVAPQVVMEVLSPGNRQQAMDEKLKFYDRYGVEEYYILDPDTGDLDGWRRSGAALRRIPQMHGWVSPRLRIRFERGEGELRLFRPNGQRFLTPSEWIDRAEAEEKRAAMERERADAAQQRADAAQQQADAAQQQADAADQERQRAAKQLDAQRQLTELERDRADKLAAKLRSLGIDPDGSTST